MAKNKLPLDLIKNIVKAHLNAPRVTNAKCNMSIHLVAHANIDINVLKLLVEIYSEGSHMQSYPEHKTYHGHGKGDTLLHCATLYPTADSETISFFVKKHL